MKVIGKVILTVLKVLIALILTVVISFGATSLVVFGALNIVFADRVNTIKGDNGYVYTTNEDGTYEIYSYDGGSREITLPAEYGGKVVSSINGNAFSGNVKISSVVIPGSIKVIEDGAFSNCPKLENVTLNDGVEYIGARAFRDCKALKLVDLGGASSTLKSIGKYAFKDCRYLEDFSIPATVTKIASEAFAGTSWYLSQYGVMQKDGWVIGCTNGYYPSGADFLGAVRIADDVFANSKTFDPIFDLSVVGTLKSIGNGAFKGIKTLVEVELPDSLELIESAVFEGCSELAKVTMTGESLTYVGANVLSGTKVFTSLSQNRVQDEKGEYAPAYAIIGNVLFDIIPGTGAYLVSDLDMNAVPELAGIKHIAGKALSDTAYTSVKLNDACVSVGCAAFENCPNLVKAELGANVQTIGERAFYNCVNLTEVYIATTDDIVCEELAFSYEYSYYGNGFEAIVNRITAFFSGDFDSYVYDTENYAMSIYVPEDKLALLSDGGLSQYSNYLVGLTF